MNIQKINDMLYLYFNVLTEWRSIVWDKDLCVSNEKCIRCVMCLFICIESQKYMQFFMADESGTSVVRISSNSIKQIHLFIQGVQKVTEGLKTTTCENHTVM